MSRDVLDRALRFGDTFKTPMRRAAACRSAGIHLIRLYSQPGQVESLSITIIDLPAGTTIVGTEVFESVQTTNNVGQSVKLNANQLASAQRSQGSRYICPENSGGLRLGSQNGRPRAAQSHVQSCAS
jgi:hypothetical protein